MIRPMKAEPAANMYAKLCPSTKACFAKPITSFTYSAGAPWARAFSLSLTATSTDVSSVTRKGAMCSWTFAGSVSSDPSSFVAYSFDRMAPRTATPSVPPTWRVASFVAEPTPAFSGGSAPIIEFVAGVIAMPIAVPINPIEIATYQ